MPHALRLVPLLLVGLALTAAEPAAESTADAAAKQRVLDRLGKLAYKTGTMAIAGDRADLALPTGYRYLEQADAQWVLQELWGNPPNPKVLGMVVPAGAELIGDGSWAMVVSYDDEGHVKDDDAKDIDYADLLKNMQEGTSENNAARAKRGYPTVDLLGWAEAPSYDQSAKKLYWAKRLRFSGSAGETLNYDVRVLGRTGTLVYSAIADAPDLPRVKEGCQQVLLATTFRKGHSYADFSASSDKVAEYGVAGLIAGGGLLVAKKIGMLALLFKFFAKGGFLLLAPVLWVVNKFRRGGAQA